jgi:hypothetical protein
MGELLERARAALGADARFVWRGDRDLLAAGVEPWTELPLWLPEDHPTLANMLRADVSRAVAAGLRFRPIEETVRDTLAWDRAEGAQPTERPIHVTPLTREREAELLAATKARRERAG